MVVTWVYNPFMKNRSVFKTLSDVHDGMFCEKFNRVLNMPPNILKVTNEDNIAIRLNFQAAFTCLKLTIAALEQGVKYVQS